MPDWEEMPTTTALLDALRASHNETVWREFDGRFRSIIVALAVRCGLAPVDAADVAQETLTEFVEDYRAGKYQREKGRLRAWILGIARHRIADVWRAKAACREVRGESAIDRLPDERRLTEIFDAECERNLLRRAMQELGRTSRFDSKTLEAFELVVIEQRRPAEAAAELGISPEVVYLAKHRCMERLREIYGRLRKAYELA